MKRTKISLIGAGNIGGTLAHLCMVKELGDVVLLDRNENYAKGKALDLAQAATVHKSDIKIIGTSDYSKIEGSDVIIITAGVPRKPGMSRDDLVETNVKVMVSVGEQIAKYAPNAFVVCVTNPLDVMVWALQESCKLPKHMVIGMAGVLDSSRFSYFIADELNVSIKNVESMVLGGHGDTMAPVLKSANVGGVPVSELVKNGMISSEKVSAIVERTRKSGGEIVGLLGNGSAFYAPASSAIAMAEAYLYDYKRIMPVAAWVDGQYGMKDIYLGVPAVIGKGGVEKILEIDIADEDREFLNTSADNVRSLIEIAKKIM